MKSKKHLGSVRILAMLSLTALSLALCLVPAVRPEGATRAPLSHGQGDLARFTQPQALDGYGKLPLGFEANQGQTDRQVKFLSRGSGYTIFLTANETVLCLSKPATPAAQRGFDTVALRQEVAENKVITTTVLRMRLVGANPAAGISGLEELPGKSNYFIGNDPKKWRTSVPAYAKVRYHHVYPGVDLVYYGNQRQLENDFILAPGADPSSITINLAGAEKLSLDPQGALVLAVKEGEVRLAKPHIYQEVDGARREISGAYVLKNTNQVGFQVAAYDVSRPLVIDPVLVYSTYLGGASQDLADGGVTTDSSGNAYISGLTTSVNFPTTAGAFQNSLRGFQDAFVTKLNPTGSSLVYSTYLGGSGGDNAENIAIDSAGNAYVVGETTSSDFPTTPGAFQTAFAGGISNGFVVKLNATGSGLISLLSG